jgi:sulfur-oxidizing protein SoxB
MQQDKTGNTTMNSKLMTSLIILVSALTSYVNAAIVQSKTDLRILWTNDTHGYLSPLYHREEGDDQYMDRAKREGKIGGFAYIASIINRQRNEFPDKTLLFDSGDSWHGTAVPVRMGGSPVVEVMNAMGYDAMVPGNVEFFYDRPTLEKLFAAARFPIVAANFYDTDWGERVKLKNVHPYIIKRVNGFKIAVIGMTYHWMSKVAHHPQWSFGLRTEEIQADINYLKSNEQVDLVIMLSHMGWKVDAHYAEQVNGIDVIVGAHTHDILYRPTVVHNKKSKRSVLVVQSGSHGKMLGQLDLQIHNRRISAFTQTLFPIRTKDITPDPKIQVLITKLRAPFKAELERVIGFTTTLLYRQGTWQSTADNLVTDALRARTGQQITIAQPGRYGATILPGPITVEDIYNLAPAESPVYHMQFRGRELRTMLEGAIDNVITKDVLQQIGANMWRYSGLAIQLDLRKPYPERIQKILINGKKMRDEQYYSLAEFNMFFKNNPNAMNVKVTDRIGPHEVIKYIEQHKQIAPKLDHRITNHHGHIMGDHDHLHEVAKQTGRSEIDINTAQQYQYRGYIDKEGYIRIQ